VLGIISAVFRDMPILFVQGNMHVQCYRSRLLWFHNNSSLMCGYCLRACFWQFCSLFWELWTLTCVYAVLSFPMFCWALVVAPHKGEGTRWKPKARTLICHWPFGRSNPRLLVLVEYSEHTVRKKSRKYVILKYININQSRTITSKSTTKQ